MKPPRIVLFQGAFEIINYGHIVCFKRAKQQGDHLIVALNTNKLLRQYKKREAVLPWTQKAGIIRACKYVDEVVQAHSFSPMRLLQKYRPAVYVISCEWTDSKKEEMAFMESIGGRTLILPRYAGIVSTSQIKQRLLTECLDNERGGVS